jgi:formylglycine-generating enzyme required for sulfatase activity
MNLGLVKTAQHGNLNMKTKHNKTLFLTAALIGLAALSVQAQDSFGSGANTFTIDFVEIGSPGNAAQSASNRSHSFSGGDGYGAVPYTYRISTYAISQNNITTATAAGMANVTAGAHSGDRPAANISWYEAAAYVNWLNTSKGYQAAYDLTWTGTAWSMALWSSADAWQLGGENLYRHKDAFYFLPSENEWYKAAYYDPATSNYFLYATGSDTAPTAVASGTSPGTAVYNGQSGPADVTQAGGLSPFGTMGQNGNTWEWMESAFDGVNNLTNESRGFRGGTWDLTEDILRSSFRGNNVPTLEFDGLGFRVASIPEPSTIILTLILIGSAFLACRRKPSL